MLTHMLSTPAVLLLVAPATVATLLLLGAVDWLIGYARRPRRRRYY